MNRYLGLLTQCSLLPFVKSRENVFATEWKAMLEIIEIQPDTYQRREKLRKMSGSRERKTGYKKKSTTKNTY